MSLAPSLFASPGLNRERSGSIQSNAQVASPFGGGASYGAPPPPLSGDRYGGGFSELRRRGTREPASGTPLGRSLVDSLARSDLARTPASALSYRGAPAAPPSAGAPPVASLLDDDRADLGGNLFSPELAASPGAQPMELASPDAGGGVFSPRRASHGGGGADYFSPAAPAPGAFAEPPPSFSFRDENERLRCWIVVFGFDARAEPRDVLETMARYGEILEHEVGRGNWLFLRYATKWQAEKALAQSAIVLDGAAGPVVVGALRLTPDVAARFGMHSARGEAQPAAAPPAAPAIKTKSDLMLHPKLRASQLKRRGCCEKLMAFLFSV